MSDIPPPLEDQGPREPDHPPPVRSRGIRGGKASKRKRTAYIRWFLQANPDLSFDQLAVIHQDKTQRPLYTRAGWTPDSLDEDDEKKTASGTFRPPAPAGPQPVFRPPEPAAPSPAGSFAPLEGTLPSEPSSPSTAFVAPQKASSQIIIPMAKAAPPTFSRLIRTPVPPTSRPREPQPPALQAKSARLGPPAKAAPKAAREEGEIGSADLGGGALIISPLTNGKLKLVDSTRLRIKRAVFFDFHNTIDRYFVPGRRQPSAIPWPNNNFVRYSCCDLSERRPARQAAGCQEDLSERRAIDPGRQPRRGHGVHSRRASVLPYQAVQERGQRVGSQLSQHSRSRAGRR